MKTFDSDGVMLAYWDEHPRGGPTRSRPVLLIHGFASNTHVNWVDTGWVATLVAAGYRVVAFDNRGHGQSEKLYESDLYTAPLMAEDARRVLDHLAIPEAHVMGYSMGARIAAFLTLAHPLRVKAVVFAGLGRNMVRPMAGKGPIAHALEAPSLADVVNPTARTFRAFAEQTGSDLKALAACIRGARVQLTEADVGRIGCPCLVVVGSDDVIAGSARDLADLIPGAQSYEIPDRDHMKTVGDKRYISEVVKFLERIR